MPLRARLLKILTSPAYTIALGLVLVGLVKALLVIVAGRRIGLPLAALAMIAIAWAAGPLAAGWVVKRVREARGAKRTVEG